MTGHKFGWDFPCGVTGNEPEITGIWPEEDPREDASEVAEREAEQDWEAYLDGLMSEQESE